MYIDNKPICERRGEESEIDSLLPDDSSYTPLLERMDAPDDFQRKEMVKPTKCPCGKLFDAKDSSFCPKCGCAYGELSGRYTNIGR